MRAVEASGCFGGAVLHRSSVAQGRSGYHATSFRPDARTRGTQALPDVILHFKTVTSSLEGPKPEPPVSFQFSRRLCDKTKAMIVPAVAGRAGMRRARFDMSIFYRVDTPARDVTGPVIRVSALAFCALFWAGAIYLAIG